MNRWTIERLREISDEDFAINILQERPNGLSNLYSPLADKLRSTISMVSECWDAMEKQRAKKPIKRQLDNTLINKIYHCPIYNKKLYDCALKNGKLDYVSPGSRKSKFCEDCGQLLDWS